MFFLFGTRRKAKVLGQMDRHCAKCTRPTVHSVIESRQWFTLFFIPSFHWEATTLSAATSVA
jgi:hypothetical protein